jgi:hypothetical protein
VQPQPTHHGAPSASSDEPNASHSQQSLAALEARLDRLEKAHEGLQDALYRHEILQDRNNDELRRRTEPEQMAHDLSRDARRRGL